MSAIDTVGSSSSEPATEPMGLTPLAPRPRGYSEEEEARHALKLVTAHYPRVGQQIDLFWPKPAMCADYVNGLILNGYDDRGNIRQGFKQEVLPALMLISGFQQKRADLAADK
jgi:hypothetical protein